MENIIKECILRSYSNSFRTYRQNILMINHLIYLKS